MEKDYEYTLFIKLFNFFSKIIKNIFEYFTRKDLILQEMLEAIDAFIISNDFCKCEKITIFKNFSFIKKCNLCKVDRVINFENENDVYFLLNNVKDKVKLILHTKGGETEYSDFIPYILRQKKIKIYSYIPQYAYSAGSFIALPSKVLYLNWYSSMGPVDTQLDYEAEGEEESFPVKYIKNLKNKENSITKLKSLEAKSYHTDDLFLIKSIFKNKKKRRLIINNFLNTENSHHIKYGPEDLKRFGLNVKIGIPQNILNIFIFFKKAQKY